jgi:hypothetical protein
MMQSDAEFLWTQFGFAGLFLCAVTFLAMHLFKLWVANKEKEHEKVLDIQKETHLESLRQISKREEIRFSHFHAKQVACIEAVYGNLYDLRELGYKAPKAEDFLPAFMEGWKQMVRSKMYFRRDLADKIESAYRVYELLLNNIQTREIMEEYLKTSPHQAMALIKEKSSIFGNMLPPLFAELEDEARKILQGESASPQQ